MSTETTDAFNEPADLELRVGLGKNKRHLEECAGMVGLREKKESKISGSFYRQAASRSKSMNPAKLVNWEGLGDAQRNSKDL